MEIAIVAADFSHAEADQLRRSMATFKAKGEVSAFRDKLVEGMVKKGYEREFSERIFKQLEGFGSYGFPESHAAAFAHLVYISCWLKCFYPDVFCVALLNSQPMGFYQPAEIVDDARAHGVTVRPVDINYSYWDTILEEKDGQYCAVRLGFRQVKGLKESDMQNLVKRRGTGYTDIITLSDAGIPKAAIERLTDADAFRSIGLDRRQALWEVPTINAKPVGIFAGKKQGDNEQLQLELPQMRASEHVVHDFEFTGLSLKAHPVSFIRRELDALHVTPTGNLKQMKDGDRVKVAGMITIRQRPGTAKGIVFITIKDETGFANLVVWEKIFEKYRKEILQAKLLMVEGKLQIEGDVIHVVSARCFNLNKMLHSLTAVTNDEFPFIPSRGDEVTAPFPYDARQIPADKTPTDIFHKGRNFH